METDKLKKLSDTRWMMEPAGPMLVPVIICADLPLIREMDDKVAEQASNVAALPGIVTASYVMPDAHWGYGFPIGGVAAFDPHDGVISAGGVGFDISCGVRTLRTKLPADLIEQNGDQIATELSRKIPAGVGSHGKLKLSHCEIDDMLTGGAKWAVEQGYGLEEDLPYIEENGCMKNANPKHVSDQAKTRQADQVGTLGSGNHYLEVQKVTEIYDAEIAEAFGIAAGDALVSIHCGSRGLGHQVATDYLKKMTVAAKEQGIKVPERELACAPVNSNVGQKYLAAMNAGINCALANRQVLTHLVRDQFHRMYPQAEISVLYDVSHNTCKLEQHTLDGKTKKLFVHRKGATRSFGPGTDLPARYKSVGQPVLIGGTMGTASYILCGTTEAMTLSFGSSCHGAGRGMSRKEATKRWHGRDIVRHLASKGIIIKSPSLKGVAEEAPGAYKDVTQVVDAAHHANLSKKVAKLEPIICVKG